MKVLIVLNFFLALSASRHTLGHLWNTHSLVSVYPFSRIVIEDLGWEYVKDVVAGRLPITTTLSSLHEAYKECLSISLPM